MGLRGPQRNPNSRRGRAEADRTAKLAAAKRQSISPAAAAAKQTPAAPKTSPLPSGDAPTCPDWLPADHAELFRSLVSELQAAGVPLKSVDRHAIVMSVQCLTGVKEALSLANSQELNWDQRLMALKLKAQLGKDLMQWLQLICATPGSRARIGLKAEPEKKMGALAKILAAKQGRKAA